jgi:hypothetical protein
MSDENGLVRPDPAILTPNDLKRAKVALDGQSPHELLAEPETMFQVLIFCVRSRTDPSFTFEQAGDVPLGEVFDMAADSPPPTPGPGGNGSGPSGSGTSTDVSASKRKRTGSAPAPSSAASSG